tara:strand:- start:2330 stop:3493 length:1164 start_codon:yes stop_codon:yes gene_type:complete
MISVILNNKDRFPDAEIHFFYRHSSLYKKGLHGRLNSCSNVHPLKLFNVSGFFLGKNDVLRKTIRRLMHIVRFFMLPVIAIQNTVALYRHFKNNTPDILFLNNGGYPGALSTRIAAVVAKVVGVKTVYMMVNNAAIPYETLLRRVGYEFDQKVKNSVDFFITGSQKAGLALEHVLGIKREQRQVFYNCIESKRFESLLNQKSENTKLIFANIALLEKRKGHIVLLQAIVELIRRRPDLQNSFHVNIDGEGREREVLNIFVKLNNLNDVVTFLGSTPNIGLVYKNCDVFVLPSISNEDLPNVISEALLFAKPVIASKLAGIPHQVFDGENGYLVEPGSVKQLSVAMERCVDNFQNLEQMGAKSREIFYKYFSVDAALENYIKIFDKGV